MAKPSLLDFLTCPIVGHFKSCSMWRRGGGGVAVMVGDLGEVVVGVNDDVGDAAGGVGDAG